MEPTPNHIRYGTTGKPHQATKAYKHTHPIIQGIEGPITKQTWILITPQNTIKHFHLYNGQLGYMTNPITHPIQKLDQLLKTKPYKEVPTTECPICT